MSLGRRAFLQFAAGAVGGTLLTPIPWKLADDSAIWTQNWSWRPSPEPGDLTEKATVCRLCDGGCGIRVRLVNGRRAVYIKGNPKHPVNRGGLCPLGAAGLQLLYAPYRVQQPLKQTASRGDLGGFQPISWDDAMKELSTRLGALRSKGTPHSVAAVTGDSRSSMLPLWRQFLTSYGSPNLFTMPSEADSKAVAASLALGRPADIAFALERADYVLSFGAGLLEGWGSCGHMQSIYGSWREQRPGKPPVVLVQVEPRGSITASKADRWIPVNPGTEAALALGIAHVMVREKLYDLDFAAASAFGFEDWFDAWGTKRQGFKNFVLAAYKPAEVSGITGVDPQRIEELAREFARQERAVAVWGQDAGATPNNVYHDLAFLALNALKGNFKRGGLVGLMPEPPLGALPQPVLDAYASHGLSRDRLDRTAPQPPPLSANAFHAFLDVMAREPAYPVEVLLVHEANPAYALSENHLFADAAAKAGLVVSFSSFMDETAVMADLVLPNHAVFERLDDVIGVPGAPFAYYALAAPVLPPRYNTRHTGDVLLTLARFLGGTVAEGLPWESYESFLRERVQGLAAAYRGAVAKDATVQPGRLEAGAPVKTNFKDARDLWNQLQQGYCWYDAPADPMELLQTASGQYEFACQRLAEVLPPIPEDRFLMPQFAPLQPSGDPGEFPLLLMVYSEPALSDGFYANPPFMNKLLPDDLLLGNDLFAQVHPRTAATVGLTEGGRALIRTPRGEAAVRVHLNPAVRPETIAMVRGLGHTAYDEYIQGKGTNAGGLVEVQMDPITGLGTVWATRAQLRRA
ncbi:molybdopterin-containing oxidoreductase family protein [Desulfoglaeba alkanexedens]|uniref:4Fe-4S Mo/W bis-MGD-type domain-containing protein n=1 Tax=Desulfoglaeba alkanexedens ALDC TaxID=980445 RepID=A0A4P8L1L1_9BACT|nr:molybdopterin-dependent oxidoreductase [Desulfoglaeba alkanexedens]QCQ20785.1 hypothetical protein FDQ92_00325 [Desulfoglaeba alkanexedens ALDC]